MSSHAAAKVTLPRTATSPKAISGLVIKTSSPDSSPEGRGGGGGGGGSSFGRRAHPFLSPHRVPEDAAPFLPEDFNVSMAELQLQQKIAKGAFGSVSRATYAGRECAVKILLGVDLFQSKDWLSELTVLKNYASHPNIIDYLGAAKVHVDDDGLEDNGYEEDSGGDCESSNGGEGPPNDDKFNIYIVSSFAAHGDLRHFWRTSEHLALDGPRRGGWPLVVKLLAGVSKALAFLHSHHVIHRDVKTQNVVVDARLESQLCDFGMARFDVNHFADAGSSSGTPGAAAAGAGAGAGAGVEGTPTTTTTVVSSGKSGWSKSGTPGKRSVLKRQLSVVGTSEFMAPEIIFQEPYDHRCDTYSLGVVMAELMCRRIPCDEGGGCSSHEYSADDLFAEYSVGGGGGGGGGGGEDKLASEGQESKDRALPKRRQPFLSRSARSWFKFDESEIVACPGAPAGLRDLCLECMQYTAEDRIDGVELDDWLEELVDTATAEEEAAAPAAAAARGGK